MSVFPPLIAAALCLILSGPSFAQGWTEYVSRADFFSIYFPGEPTVEDTTYDTEYFITLPGRVHRYENGPNRYSVTIVDYAQTEEKHDELCRSDPTGSSCGLRWETDLRGAIVYATWKFMQRDTEVTHFAYALSDLIEGHQLQLTNADGSLTNAAIYMHENRLYILEATVPAGSPAPGLFWQSMGFLDSEGNRVRYESEYSNGFAPPPRTR